MWRRNLVPSLLLIALLSTRIFSAMCKNDEDDDDDEHGDENGKKGRRTTTTTVAVTTTTEPPPKEPNESVCEENGGDLASRQFYKKNEDILVVYYDSAGRGTSVVDNSIVYKYRNYTINARVDLKEGMRFHFTHRIFPRSFINFVVVHAGIDRDAHYVTYFNRSRRQFPSDYTGHSIKMRPIALKDLNYIPPAFGGAKWMSTKSAEKYAGFYNAMNCQDAYALDKASCLRGKYCRTRDPQTGESNTVALCSFDLATNETVAIYRGTEYEAAYAVSQCNYFVRVVNSTDYNLAVFHAENPTICFKHPAEWTDVYVIRFTDTKADYACKYLMDESSPIAAGDGRGASPSKQSATKRPETAGAGGAMRFSLLRLGLNLLCVSLPFVL